MRAIPKGLCTALLLVTAASATAAAEEGAAEKTGCEPTPVRLAIPSTPLQQEVFARDLVYACGEVRKVDFGRLKGLNDEERESARGGEVFAVDSLARALDATQWKAPQRRVAQLDALESLGALQRTCEALELHQLTPEYMSVLRMLRSNYGQFLGRVDEVQWGAKSLEALFTPRRERAGRVAGPPVTSALQPLAGFEEALIQGLVEFVTNRAKAEAVLYLADKLQRTTCARHANYFPNLCRAVAHADVTMQLSAMGVLLKSASLRDLERMPDVAIAEARCGLETGRYKVGSPNLAYEALGGAEVSLAFFRAVQAGREPLQVARSLKDARPACREQRCATTFRALEFGSFLVDGMMSQADWQTLSAEDSEPLRWAAYAVGGLLVFEERYSVAHPETLFPDDETLAKAFNDAHRALVELTSSSQRLQKLLGNAERPPAAADVALEASRAFAVVIELAAGTAEHWLGPDAQREKTLRVVEDLAVFGRRLVDQREARDLAIAMTELLMSLETHAPGALQLPAPVLRTLPLAVEFANAQSSDEVAKTLEAAAAPVGSYRLKFEQPVLSLNAFVGAGGGYESVRTEAGVAGSPYVSLLAPVGLHATWPRPGTHPHHVGVFLSVLDIGNLVAVRLRDVEGVQGLRVESPSKVSFAQVLAPGAFFTLGVRSPGELTPFVLGAGVAYAPQGRELVTSATNPQTGELEESRSLVGATRFSVFLAVDVTLLPL